MEQLIKGTRSAAFVADEVLGRHDLSREALSRDQRVIIAAAEVIAAHLSALNKTQEPINKSEAPF